MIFDWWVSLSFNFLYKRISYPDDELIGILNLVKLNPDGTTFNLLEIYESRNSIIALSKFNPSNKSPFPRSSVNNVYSEGARYEWINIMIRADLYKNNIQLTVYNYKTGLSKTVSDNSSNDDGNALTLDTTQKLAVQFDMTQNTVDFSSLGIKAVAPSKTTKFEVSTLNVIPNYVYSDSELTQIRLPPPLRCDKNCICLCNGGSCADNCKLKSQVISVLDSGSINNVNISKDQTSLGFGGNMFGGDQSSSLAFRQLNKFIVDNSFQINSDQKVQYSINRFIANAIINTKDIMLCPISFPVAAKGPAQSQDNSGVSASIPSLVSWRTSTDQSGSSSSSSSSSSGSSVSSGSSSSSSSTVNCDLLFLLSNQYSTLSTLKSGTSISGDYSDYGILSARIVNSVLRIIIGSSRDSKYVSSYDIKFAKTLDQISRLNIVVFCWFRE